MSDSPSLPNLHALKDYKGNIKIEPLHAPVRGMNEYDFPRNIEPGNTPTSRRHPIPSMLTKQPTLELLPTSGDTHIVEIHKPLTQMNSDSTIDVDSDYLSHFRDMASANVTEELPSNEIFEEVP